MFRRHLRAVRFSAAGARLLGTVIILAGGLSVSLVLFKQARAAERHEILSALNDLADKHGELLEIQMTRSMESLYAIASFIRAGRSVGPAEFETFVADSLLRQPELRALGWSPRVKAGDRSSIDERLRRELAVDAGMVGEIPSGGIGPVGDHDEYYPILYLEPRSRNRAALGFDLYSSAPRRAALLRARDTGRPVATSPLQLIQEPSGDAGFIVYLPVFAPVRTREPDVGQGTDLLGFASAVFRVRDLLRPAVQGLDREGVGLKVVDEQTGASLFDSAGGSSGFTSAKSLPIAGRAWRLTLVAGPRFLAQRPPERSWEILLTGTSLTLLLGAYLWALATRTATVERRVKQRTAALSREVAERRRAEEAARRAEASYRSIFENSVEGIFQSTPDGHYLNVNAALARMYGYASPAELMADLSNIGRQLYVEPGRRDEFTRLVRDAGTVADFESQIYRRDGSVIWISENARAVADTAGNVLYYEGFVVDITPRKEADEQRRRATDELERRVRERTEALAQANAAKSRFLASVSHEIRTPMNAILGYAQLLHRDPSLHPSQREAVATIAGSGDHLLGLIDGILDLSRIEAGHVELQEAAFDLKPLAADLERMFRQRCTQKGVRLIVHTESAATRVRGDERKLRQVLINLLGNAVRFTDTGEIRLAILRGDNSAWSFQVTDTGIGIPAEAIDRIFEPFQQGHAGAPRGGTGLGLSIATQHVRLMGGELRAHSNPGAGSRFEFTLNLPPADPVSDAPAPAWESARLAEGQHLRALVVDDLAENRNVLASLLTVAGIDVVTVNSGQHAIACVSAATEPFDLIFMDILMPDMDGFDAARAIRPKPAAAGARWIAVSAAVLAHERQRYDSAGFDAILAKPLSVARLYACIGRLTGARFCFDVEPIAEQPWSPQSAADEAASLPAGLAERLRDACSLSSVTGARECATELDRLGLGAGHLARCLRECLCRYDLAPVGELLADSAAATALLPAAGEA